MNEPTVTIPKWKADSIIKGMDAVLEASGKAVASASIASDTPDSADCISFMLKDAARCYTEMREFMEQLRTDLSDGKEAHP